MAWYLLKCRGCEGEWEEVVAKESVVKELSCPACGKIISKTLRRFIKNEQRRKLDRQYDANYQGGR
jgi:hypothetical protein